MRSFAFILAAFGALILPASAETTWDKFEHGINVVKDCGGDVRQFCKDRICNGSARLAGATVKPHGLGVRVARYPAQDSRRRTA